MLNFERGIVKRVTNAVPTFLTIILQIVLKKNAFTKMDQIVFWNLLVLHGLVRSQ